MGNLRQQPPIGRSFCRAERENGEFRQQWYVVLFGWRVHVCLVVVMLFLRITVGWGDVTVCVREYL